MVLAMSTTPYTDLAAAMHKALVNEDWRTRSFTIDGISKTYATLAEYLDALRYVEMRAKGESVGRVGRTYAGNPGRASS